MNQHFQDRFYSSSIEFDLSGVLIVFSYNDSAKLDPILLDRIKEINISPYTVTEKISIAQDYILNELCLNVGIDRSKIYFADSIIRSIIEDYTIEAGVRELRRKLEQILLKLNIDRFYMRGPFIQIMKKKYIEIYNYDPFVTNEQGPTTGLKSYLEHNKTVFEDSLGDNIINKIYNLEYDDKLVITEDLVKRYLENPTITIDRIHQQNTIGVINGLYATSVGIGGIVPIQIYKNYISSSNDKNKLKLKITGNQKKVMKESVMCALTAAINLLNETTKTKIINKYPNGFHIHAGDGGTPKDGPSAGCAFATAFVSILLNKEINRKIAMTGEIQLTGKISKIGGLDAKLAGAKKSGVECVYICSANKDDYEKIRANNPEMFDNNFQIKIVEHIIDIVTDPNVIIDVKDSDFDQIALLEKHN